MLIWLEELGKEVAVLCLRDMPGSFPGFLKGTKAHFNASARGAAKIKPRASKPAGNSISW